MKSLTGIVLIMVACSHKPAKPGYVDYINDPDNKITQHITIGDVKATAKWLPAEYRRLRNPAASAAEEQDPYYYFNVKFDKTKGDKPDKNKILYLDFDMQQDFVLVNDRDSVLPAICQKVENGIGGSYEFMLAFEKNEDYNSGKGFNLIYKDKIFGIGTIAFVYNRADIEKIPDHKKENVQ